MTRTDRFIATAIWLQVVGGLMLLATGIWAFWLARSYVLLLFGGASLAFAFWGWRQRARLPSPSDHGHRPLA